MTDLRVAALAVEFMTPDAPTVAPSTPSNDFTGWGQPMAPPISTAATVYDSFTRAATASGLGALDTGQTWQQDSGFKINGQHAVGNGSEVYAYVAAPSPDHIVQATLVTVADMSLMARRVDNNNFWLAHCSDNPYWKLYKKQAGTYTEVLFTGTPKPTAGQVVQLRCIGTSIQLYVDGALALATTDTFATAGATAGFRQGAGANGSWDDFTIT